MIQLMFPLNHVKCAWIGGPRLNMEINIIPPGGDITKVCTVELTVESTSNSLKDLKDWYREKKGKEGSSTHVTKYTKMLGSSRGLVHGKGLIASLRNGQPLVESESYPEISKCFKDLHIQLNMFPSSPCTCASLA